MSQTALVTDDAHRVERTPPACVILKGNTEETPESGDTSSPEVECRHARSITSTREAKQHDNDRT